MHKCPYCGKLVLIGSHDHSNDQASSGNRGGGGGCGDGRGGQHC